MDLFKDKKQCNALKYMLHVQIIQTEAASSQAGTALLLSTERNEVYFTSYSFSTLGGQELQRRPPPRNNSPAETQPM